MKGTLPHVNYGGLRPLLDLERLSVVFLFGSLAGKFLQLSYKMNAVSSDEKWPVIIHSSLQNTDIFTLLNAIHKTRGIYILQFVSLHCGFYFSQFFL